jgi:hypothetical protein
MLKPSISGCSGLSEASFSRLLERRGCSEDDVVDLAGVDAGAADRLRDHGGGEVKGVGVGQRPLVRGADRGPGARDDHCLLGHAVFLTVLNGWHCA